VTEPTLPSRVPAGVQEAIHEIAETHGLDGRPNLARVIERAETPDAPSASVSSVSTGHGAVDLHLDVYSAEQFAAVETLFGPLRERHRANGDEYYVAKSDGREAWHFGVVTIFVEHIDAAEREAS
jgi:hypothetical protein